MKSILTLSALLILLNCIYSQDFKPTDPIPVDPDVKIGKLENGMTYYIRKNVKPEKRAEFFLVVNAGAIQEDDDQNGLAHFAEHMAFNGTKNFKKHEIVNYLQSIGMKFGPEINAFTSFDVTNYMLQKVPTDVKENVDTALLILYDWASNVSFENEEIDNERGVIHEEWRTGSGPDYRMSLVTDKIILEGSKYAKRDVIGDINIIDNAKYDVFKRFYKDWYRPDLQAIIVIGDIDVAEMEKKVKDLFSKIPKAEKSRKREYFDVPDHLGMRIAIAKDAEATMTGVEVTYKHTPTKDKTTLAYLKDNLKVRLFNELLNNRLEEYTQKPDAAFSMAFGRYGSLRVTKDAFTTTAYAGNNKAIASLEIILTEHKRIKEFGFTANELDIAKKEVLKGIERAFKEKDKNESTRFAWQYYSHFLENNPIPSADFNYQFSSKTLPQITLAEINELGKKLITADNMFVVITGPDNQSISIPTEEEVKKTAEKVKSAKVEPYKDIVIDKPLVKNLPAPGTITKTVENKELGFTEFTLSNGAKVIVKKTDFKADEILFKCYSAGGFSLYGQDDDVSARIATSVLSESGLGDFSKIELTKLLSSRIIRLNPGIGELYERMNGSTRPEDLVTMLQMVYLYFTNPKFTQEGFDLYVSKQKTFLENKKLDPESAFRDTVAVTLSQNHPRQRPWSVELFNEAKLDRMEKIYRERFSNPGDFTFVFVGNVDAESLKPLLEKFIASIKSDNKAENWKDLGINAPEKAVKKVVKKPMKVAKGTVAVFYKGKIEYNLKNDVILSVLNDVLDVRYTETIREEQSGTYGVGVNAYIEKTPKEEYSVSIGFDCDPAKAEQLVKIVYDEINKLKTTGPEQKYIDNCIKNKVKELEENKKQNNFWMNCIESMYLNENHYLAADYLKILNSVTIEDVKNMANIIFKDNNLEFMLIPE